MRTLALVRIRNVALLPPPPSISHRPTRKVLAHACYSCQMLGLGTVSLPPCPVARSNVDNIPRGVVRRRGTLGELRRVRGRVRTRAQPLALRAREADRRVGLNNARFEGRHAGVDSDHERVANGAGLATAMDGAWCSNTRRASTVHDQRNGRHPAWALRKRSTRSSKSQETTGTGIGRAREGA